MRKVVLISVAGDFAGHFYVATFFKMAMKLQLPLLFLNIEAFTIVNFVSNCKLFLQL